MELAGASADDLGGGEIRADGFRRRDAASRPRALTPCGRIRVGDAGCAHPETAFEESSQLVDRHVPGVALIPDISLQHDQRRRCVARALVADVADDLRHARATVFGEVAADFDVGIEARFETPEQLEHELLTELNRRVALVGGETRDRHQRIGRHLDPRVSPMLAARSAPACVSSSRAS